MMASPQSYLAFLRNSKLEALSPSPEVMINVQAIAINFGLDYPLVRILLAAPMLAAVLLLPKSASFDRWFWSAVCGGLLISPHPFGYDAALLLVPILKIVCDSNAAAPIRWIAATAVIPMPYSAGPAILMTLLFAALSLAGVVRTRWVAAGPSPTMA